MILLFYTYSFILGIFIYYLFNRDLEYLFLFVLIFEIFAYIFYHLMKRKWYLSERIMYNALFFLGYFISFLLHDDFDPNRERVL